MDKNELDQEKERQKELIKQLGIETLMKSQQKQEVADKEATEMLSQLNENLQEFKETVEGWLNGTPTKSKTEKPNLHLVPPLTSEKSKENAHEK